MVDRLEEIALLASKGRIDKVVEVVDVRRRVDELIVDYRAPGRTGRPQRVRFEQYAIPEDPLHIRTVVKDPYKRPYPYRGVNFP